MVEGVVPIRFLVSVVYHLICRNITTSNFYLPLFYYLSTC